MRYYDSMSPHDDKWMTYQDPYGTTKIFAANVNNNDEVVTYLSAEVSVEMVQIIPGEFENGKAMRLEIDACADTCKVCAAAESFPAPFVYRQRYTPHAYSIFKRNSNTRSCADGCTHVAQI